MIVSFHPLIPGDRNFLCAGRDPGAEEIAATRTARAVILPQGCPRPLYETARAACPHVFPNYDARWLYHGKTGQTRLFMETGTPHPGTDVFQSVAEYRRRCPAERPRELPCVFKFDWGGEGDTVFLIRAPGELEAILSRAAECEKTGQRGFLIQRWVPTGGRSVRVVRIGEHLASYWRVNPRRNGFHTSLSKGGTIDSRSDPKLRRLAAQTVTSFCRKTGINLAGLDVLFDVTAAQPTPLLLEINYFFGRVGIGGSHTYYRILRAEIRKWIERIGP